MTEFGEGGGIGKRGGKPWPDATADRPAVTGSSPAPPLHLLRPFTEWHWHGRHLTTVEEAEEYVQHIAELGFEEFYTATSRAPKRVDEMKGGSLYFVRSRLALFRMPFKHLESDDERAGRYRGRHLVIMEPRVIRVEQRRVGFVRGWRYLEDKDAPPDLPRVAGAGDAPPEMARELKELGLA